MTIVHSLLKNHLAPIKAVLEKLIAADAKPYLVGGAVRDLILNLPSKDIDIEVHGLNIEQLQEILESFAPVKLMGKQFGVLRFYSSEVDWSLPRLDSKGRKPNVTVDPRMTIAQACGRRDITMNAMAVDLTLVITHFEKLLAQTSINPIADLGLCDPYDGLSDIKANRIRAVDTALFIEDPLRFYRVMHFAARFEMTPDAELNQLCATMKLSDTETGTPLSRERIYEEIRKLFLRSRSPSLGFRWIAQIGRLKELFPELHALIATPQRADYHPEGNAFEHSMQALDAAAHLAFGDSKTTTDPVVADDDQKFMIMLASLCHDLGKAVATTAALTTHGHDLQGVPIAKEFLKRFILSPDLTAPIYKLIRHHLMPWQLMAQNSNPKAYKRLALALAPETSLYELALVALCDRRGRNGSGPQPLTTYGPEFAQFIEKISALSITYHPEKPLLLGRDIADLVPAGPLMGKALEHAYNLQIEDDLNNIDELKAAVAQWVKKQK